MNVCTFGNCAPTMSKSRKPSIPSWRDHIFRVLLYVPAGSRFHIKSRSAVVTREAWTSNDSRYPLGWRVFVGGKSFQVPCFETPTRVPFFSRGGASKLYFACRPLSLLLTCSECPPPALISCCWDTLSVVPLILFLFDTGFISLSHSKGSFWGNEDNACHHPTRLQGDIHINFNA